MRKDNDNRTGAQDADLPVVPTDQIAAATERSYTVHLTSLGYLRATRTVRSTDASAAAQQALAEVGNAEWSYDGTCDEPGQGPEVARVVDQAGVEQAWTPPAAATVDPFDQLLINLINAVDSRGGVVQPKCGPLHVRGAVGEQVMARMYVEACRQLGRTPILWKA